MENQNDINQQQSSEQQKEIFQTYTWQWFFAKEAEGITASSAGVEYSHFIKRHFGMDIDYRRLIIDSVKELAGNVRADFNETSTNDLVSRCEEIRRRYLDYLDTKIQGDAGIVKTQIDNLLELERLAGNTARETIKITSIPPVLGLIGFACSLHLLVIIEVIPGAADFNDTLTRLASEYGNLLERGSAELSEQAGGGEAAKDHEVFKNLANAWRLLPNKHGL
ncbi:hypothetical protein [Peribacillus glennii]|uniref:Uncharacterized protein n=1 Tax=Peribacillus glennii TaxID=2303991 RepID=A0A372LH25_9BACI|nr:hypothetical protein [Peribacillus glennii]RFU64916.1 hypothetical protein D0466_03070 [Peribacillus glennii]